MNLHCHVCRRKRCCMMMATNTLRLKLTSRPMLKMLSYMKRNKSEVHKWPFLRIRSENMAKNCPKCCQIAKI